MIQINSNIWLNIYLQIDPVSDINFFCLCFIWSSLPYVKRRLFIEKQGNFFSKKEVHVYYVNYHHELHDCPGLY